MKTGIARQLAVLVLLPGAWSCTRRSEPERAVIGYVEHVREGRCEDAFRQLSSRYRDALEAERRAREAERAESTDPPEPIEILYCNPGPMDRVDLDRTRLAHATDSVADVRMVERVPAGHLVPGFWATRRDDVERPMRVVMEGGAWRVEDPRMLESLEQFRTGRMRNAEVRAWVRERNAGRR